MSGHTPGPWWICIDDSGDKPVTVPSIQAPEELDCAIVHWDGFWQPYWQSARGLNEMMANARLIAAAPDLLEALELAISVGIVPISSAMDGGANAHSIQVRVADQIRAAIAKAKGSSNG